MDPSPIIEYFRDALMSARRAKDRPEMDLLRTVLAAIDNAGAVEVQASVLDDGSGMGHLGAGVRDLDRRMLTGDDVVSIVRAEAAETAEAADSWRKAGNEDRARELDGRAARIGQHLRSLGVQP